MTDLQSEKNLPHYYPPDDVIILITGYNMLHPEKCTG